MLTKFIVLPPNLLIFFLHKFKMNLRFFFSSESFKTSNENFLVQEKNEKRKIDVSYISEHNASFVTNKKCSFLEGRDGLHIVN